MIRSLAFTLPLGVYAAEVQEVITDHAPPWFRNSVVVDRFAHERDGASVHTLTFELSFDQQAAARTADEVNSTCELLVQAVHQKLGDRGVRQRA